jgi:hypothetical protein
LAYTDPTGKTCAATGFWGAVGCAIEPAISTAAKTTVSTGVADAAVGVASRVAPVSLLFAGGTSKNDTINNVSSSFLTSQKALVAKSEAEDSNSASGTAAGDQSHAASPSDAAPGSNQPAGDKDASTPTGQRGSPIDVKPGTNEPTTIGGRDYTGHALDRMQGRGVPPSAVEDAIQNGQQSPGNTPDTTVNAGDNKVTVVTGADGQVITVIAR